MGEKNTKGNRGSGNGSGVGGSARQKIMTIFPPQMSAKSDRRQGERSSRRTRGPLLAAAAAVVAATAVCVCVRVC